MKKKKRAGKWKIHTRIDHERGGGKVTAKPTHS